MPFLLCALCVLCGRIKNGSGKVDINGTFRFARWLEKLAIAPVLLYRRARYGYAFRRIPLTAPRYAKVDPDDYHHLRKYEWFSMKEAHTFYAVRRERIGTSSRHTIVRMHRQLINPARDRLVDHVNGDGVDNRTANIRQATHAQNMANRKRFRSKTGSIYKGVFFRRGTRRPTWQAGIRANGKNIYLGVFTDESEAARAYDEAAKKHHGEFACLNFPDPERHQPGTRSIFWAWLCSLIRLIKPLPRLLLARPQLTRSIPAPNSRPRPILPASKAVPRRCAPGRPAGRVGRPAPRRAQPRPPAKSKPNNIPSSARPDDDFNLLARAGKPLKAPITMIWGHFSPRKTTTPRPWRGAPVPCPVLAQCQHYPSGPQRHHPIRPP